MKRMWMLAAAAGLVAPFAIGGAAPADPGDDGFGTVHQTVPHAHHWREQFKIRAECDKKLAEADSRGKFHKELRECRKKLAEWDRKQREEAFKAWQEFEKKRYERWED